MLVRNLTPFLHAVRVTSRRPPRPEMTVVVRGAFVLAPGKGLAVAAGEFEGDLRAQGKLSSHRYADDDDEMLGQPSCPDDLVDFKLNAEVLFVGHCHAPGGKKVPACPVQIGVGAWQKTLRISGRRTWSGGLLGQSSTEAHPFSTLPVDWAHAFGGAGFDANPAGRGAQGIELPNVEYPERLVRGQSDRPEPASFAPLNPGWPPRRDRRGTKYGRGYAARAPFFAEDFDWRHFSQAPADQQLAGYVRGDEALRLVNLHAEHPVLETRLPASRIRCFARVGDAAVAEVVMNLDTVTVDERAGVVLLTWRGLCPVQENDLADVRTVLIATEPLDEARKPAHYLAALEAAEADPLEMAKYAGELQRRDDKLASLDATRAALDKLGSGGQDALADETARVLTAAGVPNDVVTQATSGIAAAALAKRERAPESADTTAAAGTAKRLRAYPPPFILPEPGKPLPIPPDAGRDKMLTAVRAQLDAADRDASASLSQLPDGAGGRDQVKDAIAKLDGVRALLDDPRFANLQGPAYVEPAAGADLSRQDLREADLRGRDLSGCNLRQAQLGGADLRGAKLVGADLSHAVLVEANLEGADLSRTTLRLTNFSRARAPGIALRGARFDTTLFEDASLIGADLSECAGHGALFVRTDLQHAKVNGASLRETLWIESAMRAASFAKATLESCVFLQCHGEEMVFDDALLSKTQLTKSSARGSSFRGARGERVVFLDATLDKADFGWAVLPNAFFNGASLAGAIFTGANLREARFYRSKLRDADLTHANLMRADLRKSDLSQASLRRANLYQAVLFEAFGKDTDFSEANLTGCRLPG